MQHKLTEDTFNSVNQVKKDLKDACASIHDELEDLRDNADQSYVEIGNLDDRITNVEIKLEKLIDLVMEMASSQTKHQSQSIELSNKEQEVFLILYTSDMPLSVQEIVKRLGLTEEVVESCLRNMNAKGVTLLTKVLESVPHYFLDRSFKEQHARNGIVMISPEISADVLGEYS
ncbi:hypothetical protein JW868_02190 [Candidatus Woesearchaeota archaeon]|nr:hypothetical protein [Candidatus Woesearchaeota archaeon]